jgi:hypothetical protein
MYATGITIQSGTASTNVAVQAQGVWVRAGLADCLAPTNFNSTSFLMNIIPTHFKFIDPELTTVDQPENILLQQYISIIGWSLDYLKTALAVAQNANNPDIIPLNDLLNLALTVGFPFEPEISAGVIRNGLKNVATLVQQRGTIEGIVAYVTNLAGMSLDLQNGYNMMLDDNTSNFKYPAAIGIWNSTQTYQINDIVDYLQYKYISNIANNINHTPSGTNSNNTQWNVLYYTSDQGPATTSPATTAPAAGAVITTYPIFNGPGQYVINWTVTLGGTTASGDANNFSLVALDINGNIVSTLVATSTNTSSTGSTTQTGVRKTIPSTAVALAVIAIAAGTSTATYAAKVAVPYLLNPTTGWVSTYEPRWASATNLYPGNTLAGTDITALRETIGIIDPLDSTHNHSKGLKIKNNSGGTTTIDLRSVSRLPSDITAVAAQPDPTQVINDGIPIPYTIPQQLWNSTTAYQTGQIVQYQGLPFQALKASTNIAPSSNYAVSNEWQPLGYDARIQMMASAYSTGDLGGTVTQFNIQPYVYFYDQAGLPIAQLLPRSPGFQVPDATVVATTNQSFNHTSGTVLTATATGATTIDGVTLSSVTQTVLLTAQSSGSGAADNGYYTVSTVGAGGISTVLTRYTTGIVPAASYPDSYVNVQLGTAGAGKTYYCTNTSTPTLGTTALTFSQSAPTGTFYPTSLVFDSFAKPADWGGNATLHSPEVGLSSGSQFTYTAQSNNFLLDAFNSGVVKPSNPNSKCIVTTNYGSAAAMLGITIVTTPLTAGFVQGVVGRLASATSYIRIDQSAIVQNNGGVFTILAAHSTAAQAGDRLTALFNGNTITAYVNGVQVSQATSISFNNTQTNFGYIYDSQSTVSGTTQKKATVANPRRLRRSIRAVSQTVAGRPLWALAGSVQKRATVPVPRRAVARSFVKFIPVVGSNRVNGQVQPRAAQANQRNLGQRHRAFIQFKPQHTTDLYNGSVQPESTVMLPRRRKSRAFIGHSANTYSYRNAGTVQPRTAQPVQRPKTQRSRAVPVGAGHFGTAFYVPGTRQHQIAVSQRSIAQRARAHVKYSLVDAVEVGPGQFGPAGRTQRNGFVAQRSMVQRHRGMVGNQALTADVEETPTGNRYNGTIQPRATIPTPRRASSRARVGNNALSGDGQPGRGLFGPSGLQPMTARPVQRLMKQRGRAVINVSTAYENGPDQSRGPSGITQARATLPVQRAPKQRSRGVVVMNRTKTSNRTMLAQVGGLVTRRARPPHRRARNNG